MPLFLRKGCFPGIFKRENSPLRRSGKRPIEDGKRPIKEGKRATNAIGSAKTDPVRFKCAFGEGRLKDKFPFFEAYENPIPKRRKLLANAPIF